MSNHIPAMRRQRERGRSDRAFLVINGKRHKLGVWGSDAAEARYRELIAGVQAEPPEPKAKRAADADLPTRPMPRALNYSVHRLRVSD